MVRASRKTTRQGLFIWSDMNPIQKIAALDELDEFDRLLLIWIVTADDAIYIADIAIDFGRHRNTITRHVGLLRDQGYVTQERTAKGAWRYTVAPEYTLKDTPNDTPGDTGDTPEGTLKDTPNDTPNDTPRVYKLGIIPGGLENRDSEKNPKGENDVKLIGPQGALLQTIEVAAQAAPRAREEKAERKRKPSSERFAVGKNKRRLAFDEKTVDEYNCNDIELVMQDAWKAQDLPGKPFRFTNADRKWAKEMIDDQSAEAVVTTVQYVIEHWGELLGRFPGLNGAPSMNVIYAYRRSWVPEALRGGPEDVKRKLPGEYDAEAAAESPDFGWGDI